MTARFVSFTAWVAFSVLMGSASIAKAEQTVRPKKTTETTTITTTTVESDGSEDSTPTTDATASAHDDNEISQNFGSLATTGMSGCKTEELSQSVVKDLKSDCGAWLKDQKSHLKDKFVTGVCEEHCSDCQMNLRRCMVTGTVRYAKAPTKK